MLFLKSFVFFSTIFCVFSQELGFTSIKSNVGEIIGSKREHFTAYLGIPYGDVSENDPFGPATPHPPFKTPFEAFTDLAICPQFVNGQPTGTINCLQLNIYTPNDKYMTKNLPVMIFIHGGAFVEGDSRLSTYSPKFLVRHNVIVVTIHYRLGPYGFLCLKGTEYNNQGLKDQYLALKWVKNNINEFGGNDENITLFGHSAGSISIDFLMLFTEKLFDKVILQSGNAVTPAFYEEGNTKFINTLANEIGFKTDKLNVKEFMKIVSHINSDYMLKITQNDTFNICIDGSFVKKTPDSDLENISIMVGSTSKEALYFYPNKSRDFTENYDFKSALQKAFSNMDAPAVEAVKNFYLQDGVSKFASDFIFNYPSERSIRYYVKEDAIVYRYLFNYDGGRNFMKVKKHITAVGSTHGDELGYIFDMDILKFGPITKEDKLMIDRMTLMWTNFAKYGDPVPTTDYLIPFNWSSLINGKSYLSIDRQLENRKGSPFEKEAYFWDQFYDRYGKFYRGISLGEDWQQKGIKSNGVMNNISTICMFLVFVVIFQ